LTKGAFKFKERNNCKAKKKAGIRNSLPEGSKDAIKLNNKGDFFYKTINEIKSYLQILIFNTTKLNLR
jgi:hypothetical protein